MSKEIKFNFKIYSFEDFRTKIGEEKLPAVKAGTKAEFDKNINYVVHHLYDSDNFKILNGALWSENTFYWLISSDESSVKLTPGYSVLQIPKDQDLDGKILYVDVREEYLETSLLREIKEESFKAISSIRENSKLELWRQEVQNDFDSLLKSR